MPLLHKAGFSTNRGLVINGKDPQMVLSTMLWRKRDQVARVNGGGYWLAEVPNEAAGYDPKANQKGPVVAFADLDGEQMEMSTDEYKDLLAHGREPIPGLVQDAPKKEGDVFG